MKAALLSLIIVASQAAAGPALVVPMLTRHISHEPTERNDRNPGIGFEYRFNNDAVGVIHLEADSFKNRNDLIYYSRTKNISRHLRLSGSLYYGLKYETHPIAPAITVQYYDFRIVTTYPFAALFNAPSDVISVQYIVDF